MTLERGALLHNRYRVVEILGQGGMGAIYRAVDDNLGVEVAIKENLFTTDEYARQFRREAIILANLRHANLPRVSDHFVIEGQGQYLIMDYFEGEDLRDRMDRVGLLPEAEAIIIGVQICDALEYMHSRKPPVLHRDIKPGNVRVSPQGHVSLVDFGLAKVYRGGEATSTGARAMTPGYSPPEQYGAARTDNRSDIYSLGATLYAGLTGVIPEDSLARTMEQTVLTPLRKRNSKVSRRLANAIEKALSVHPEDRFQSAEAFKQALLNARGITMRRIAEEGTLPPPPDVEDDEISDEALGPPKANDEQPLEDGESLLARIAAISEPDMLPAPPPRPKRKRAWGCLWTALIVIVLITVGGGIAYQLDPTLPNRAISFLPPELGLSLAPTATRRDELAPTALPTQTVESFVPTVTQVESPSIEPVSPTDVPQPSVIPSITPTFSPTPSPTATPKPLPSFTPTATALGGGAGQLAFASNRTGTSQIWVINSDGTGLRQVTDTQQGACQPDWSPDGEQIVFISPCDVIQEIYRESSMFIIQSDGSGLTPLPSVGGGDYNPAWSPDGSTIAFTSLRTGDRPQIYLMDVENYEVVQLTEGVLREFQPSWSADSSQIIYISTRKGPYQVWIMNADGSDKYRFSVSGDLKDTYPKWSPDGQVIVFTQSEGEGSVVRLVGARYPDGAVQEFKLFPFPGLNPMRKVDFSSDGFWIAFESWPKGANHDIYIMTPNGAELTQLTTDPALDFDPAWRPVQP
jgi:serine/threonine protein kinase